MSEEVNYPISYPEAPTSIRAFPDDTIQTMRMRIGNAVGIHPDRLRIYVQTDLPANYYANDSRKWEELFLRMSPEGKPIGKASLEIYSTYTSPSWSFEDGIYDKTRWMTTPSLREEEFQELRVLGVPESASWILPLDTAPPPFLPPASKVGIEGQTLFQSLHPGGVGFRVLSYQEGLSPQAESLYFPLLRSGSPERVPEEILRSISAQSKLVKALSERPPQLPGHQSVMRVRWKIPMLNTDFGQSVRNRFEQIFYGTTVSKMIPSVSFFGSRQEQSRHKFYTPTSNPKYPLLDLKLWSYWWTASKPSKNKPALIFYNGTGRFVYDRLTITATEMSVACHRSEDTAETIDSLKAHIKSWIESIDGVAAFLDTADLEYERWTIQDVSASLRYAKPLKEADFRRFDCLRSIFEIVNHDQLLFKLLRADQTDLGLSPLDIQTIQLLRENEGIQAADLAEQLGISEEEAGIELDSIQRRIQDRPEFLDAQLVNMPTFKFTANTAVVTYAIDLPRIVRYISILRDILGNPDDTALDEFCPRRLESVSAIVGEIPAVEIAPNQDEGLDFLDDLLGEIGDIGVIAQPASEVTEAPKKAKKIQTKGSNSTLATYLLTQLRDFDSDTYDPEDTQILRKCDRPRQPIVLRPAEMEALRNGEYEPTNVLDVQDPDGHIICPEFWCTHDRIPLTSDQLGIERECPVCKGKVRSTDKEVEKTQDLVEFPVIQRDSSIVFPGYVKYKSKKNGRPIPCCFTTQQGTKKLVPKDSSTAEAFYVLGETKGVGSLRLGYIPRRVGTALGLKVSYADALAAGNRIQAGQSGYFRVGVGHASETLPQVLNFPGKVKPPSQNREVTTRCSFFRTWRGADESVDYRIDAIDRAYKANELSPSDELEYTALALECQLFLLYVVDGEVQIGCSMNVGSVRSVQRACVVLVTDGELDYISHVARITTVPQFTANIYKEKFYPKSMISTLIALRGKACMGSIPTIDDAVSFVSSSESLKMLMPEITVILDPYKRAQAFFVAGSFLLPFAPTSQVPTFLERRIPGFADIPSDELPHKREMLDILADATHRHSGYAYAHDLSTQSGNVVEILTRSGLRIPVRPEGDSTHKSEILHTVSTHSEDELVWGKPDPDATKLSKTITYEAEVFDFLLYQLSYDLNESEDYAALRTALQPDHPTPSAVEPLLKSWADDTLSFVGASSPPEFVRKLRSPCSKGDCSGNLCAWSGASCRVEVKQVKDTLNKAPLLRRLLSTLVSNDKIRNVVLQHRTSPFFSSVLYLEAPNELIISDTDVAKRLKTGSA